MSTAESPAAYVLIDQRNGERYFSTDYFSAAAALRTLEWLCRTNPDEAEFVYLAGVDSAGELISVEW